jgi:hypothetical protein
LYSLRNHEQREASSRGASTHWSRVRQDHHEAAIPRTDRLQTWRALRKGTRHRKPNHISRPQQHRRHLKPTPQTRTHPLPRLDPRRPRRNQRRPLRRRRRSLLQIHPQPQDSHRLRPLLLLLPRPNLVDKHPLRLPRSRRDLPHHRSTLQPLQRPLHALHGPVTFGLRAPGDNLRPALAADNRFHNVHAFQHWLPTWLVTTSCACSQPSKAQPS